MPTFRKLLDLDTPGRGPDFPLGDFSAGGVDFSAKSRHTPRMEFTPTAEQNAITVAADTGDNLVATAVAGSGKTSTLKLIAQSRPSTRFLLLAFGKDIQLAASKWGLPNVEARTAHSLALAWLRANRADLARKLDNDPKPWDAPKVLRIPGQGMSFGENVKSAKALAGIVNVTIDRFCRTANAEVTANDVPRMFDGDDQRELETFILPFARKAWADITNPHGALKFSFGHYLKLWSLACPQLPFDCVLFDEAQDANPAIAHVVTAQRGQIIMVGDASQAIYGWNGAVDALSKFDAPHRLTLTQSFRFGNSIAAFANRFLDALDAEVRVVGNAAKDDTVTTLDTADAILCRTNAGVIEQAIIQLEAGKRVAIAGGVKELVSFFKAAAKMMAGGYVVHPDLAGFDNWQDVVAHAKTDEGAELRVRVNLVESYGAERLLDVLANLLDVKKASPADYDVVISTAHKAKGLEWDSVKIAPDFKLPTEEGALPSEADLMLMYVAVTRAKLRLDPGMLAMLFAA